MIAEKPVGFDLEKEIKDTISRLSQFEEDVQTGVADELDDSQAARRRVERERAKQLLKYRSDVEQIVARPDGRRVMWRILAMAGPNRISHVPGDAFTTAFNEGKRAVANEILLMLWDTDPNVYAQMQRENHSDLKSELERKKKESNTNG